MNMGKADFYKYYIDYEKKRKSDLIHSHINRMLKHQVWKCDSLYNLHEERTKRGHQLVDRETVNSYIYDKIIEGSPFLCGRFGSVEARYCAATEAYKLGIIKKIPTQYTNALKNNAGFFSIDKDNQGELFYETMKNTVSNADCIGYWGDGMQEYLIDEYCRKDMILTKLVNIHPYDYSGVAWTKALENKRVVVVHPFKESIEKQYKNREKIWSRTDILPIYNLRVVQAVQTIGGEPDNRFETWFDALNYMYQEVISEDFDVALVGCGAYGFPLASMIKNAGKSAIHLGGVLQVLFGIKGGRFDNYDDFKNIYYNNYWIRPSENERPKNYKKIENGCYW